MEGTKFTHGLVNHETDSRVRPVYKEAYNMSVNILPRLVW